MHLSEDFCGFFFKNHLYKEHILRITESYWAKHKEFVRSLPRPFFRLGRKIEFRRFVPKPSIKRPGHDRKTDRGSGFVDAAALSLVVAAGLGSEAVDIT